MAAAASEKVSYEEVATLCDAAVVRGEPPPSARGLLGEIGRGSLTTILKHRQRWHGERGASRVMESVAFPIAIQRAVLDEINRQVAEARGQLEAELADTHASIQAVIFENEKLNTELEGAIASMERMQDQLSQQAGQIEQLRADLIAAGDRGQREREAAEQARQALAKAELRLESLPRLESELAGLRQALAGEREARVSAEQRAAVADAQKNAIESRLTDLLTREQQAATQLADCGQHTRELSTALADSRVQAEAGKGQLDAANRALEEVRRELAEARNAERKAAKEAAELRGQLNR